MNEPGRERENDPDRQAVPHGKWILSELTTNAAGLVTTDFHGGCQIECPLKRIDEERDEYREHILNSILQSALIEPYASPFEPS